MSIFSKPREVQQQTVRAIKDAYPGHVVFPLAYYFVTDISVRHPQAFILFAALVYVNSATHFSLALFFDKITQKFGHKFWNATYFVTLSLASLFFLVPLFYSMNVYGVWSPESIFSLLIVAMALEGFAKFCYQFFEAFLVGTLALLIPLEIGLLFFGATGMTIALVALAYSMTVVVAAFGSYRQFSELIAEKRTSRESQEKLQELLDLMPAKVIQVDKGFALKIFNKEFQRGYQNDSEVEIKKGSTDWMMPLDGGFRNIVNNFTYSAMQDLHFERLVNLGSGPKWYFVALKKTQGLDSDEKNLIIVALDIDVKKKNETELEEQRISSINASRLASLGELAGGIAHEINNPLSIIVGNATLLANKIQANKFEEEAAVKTLKKIQETGFRIGQIINGMRNLIRDDSISQIESNSLLAIVNDSLGLCQERFKSSGVKIDIDEKALDVMVKCNYQQVGQVVINLLNNAFDIISDHEAKEIKVKLVDQGEKIFLQVWDSGPGVKDEAKLFQPFYTTKQIGKGTGLGLSLSKKMAQKNDGDLTYHRHESWTVFTLSLLKSISHKKAA